MADLSNSFKSKTTLTAGGKTYAYFSLPAAEKAGLAQAYVSQVETGKRAGTVETLKKLASALRVALDDIA